MADLYDWDVHIFNAQSEIGELEQQAAALYGEIGRQAYAQDPEAWPQGAALQLLQSNLAAAQEKLTALQEEKAAAEAEAARIAAEAEAARIAAEEEAARLAAEAEAAAAAERYRCRNCGTVSPEGTKFCHECGTSFAPPPPPPPPEPPAPPAKKFCGNCGTEVAPGTKFCGGCGAKQF